MAKKPDHGRLVVFLVTRITTCIKQPPRYEQQPFGTGIDKRLPGAFGQGERYIVACEAASRVHPFLFRQNPGRKTLTSFLVMPSRRRPRLSGPLCDLEYTGWSKSNASFPVETRLTLGRVSFVVRSDLQ